MATSPSSRQHRSPPEEVSFVESMRWLGGVVPLAAVVLMGAAAGARPPARAADAAWEPPPCSDAGPPGKAETAASVAPAWYRLDVRLDAEGTLAGHDLVVGVVDGEERTVQLPAEAFATGPRDGILLIGEDDGSRSRLSLLDVGRGCRTTVADEASVVRSALIAPDGASIVEHRVDRATRADLGVWWRPLEGGRSVRLLAGVPADGRYGRTFSTELRTGADGRIAATSCGEQACRTRLLDQGAGRVRTVGPTGNVVGLAGDGSVVAYARCPGLPCAVLLHREGRGPRTLAPAAGRAALAGDTLVFEVALGRLATLDARTGSIRSVEGDGLVPIAESSRSLGGADHAPGVAVLARDGRVDANGRALEGGSVSPMEFGDGVR